MNDEVFDQVYTQYIDTAQLYQSEEFEKVTYITFLTNRINSVKLSIVGQKLFLKEFGQPYIPNFDLFKKFGHRLKWNEDTESFIAQLDKVELREKLQIAQLEAKMKELHTLRESKPKEEITEKQKKEGWIRMINTLRKVGYVIDKDKDSVEDLSVMVKQQIEENKTSEQ